MKMLEPLCVSSDSSRGDLFPSAPPFPPAQLTSADTTVIQNSLPNPTLAFLIRLSQIFLFSASVSAVSLCPSVSLSSFFFQLSLQHLMPIHTHTKCILA